MLPGPDILANVGAMPHKLAVLVKIDRSFACACRKSLGRHHARQNIDQAAFADAGVTRNQGQLAGHQNQVVDIETGGWRYQPHPLDMQCTAEDRRTGRCRG